MRIATNKKTMLRLGVLFAIAIICSSVIFINEAKASGAGRIVDSLTKEGLMLGINGLPWGAKIEYYNKSRPLWEYTTVWGFWKEYLSNTAATDGYLQLECRKDNVGGLIDFNEPMEDGFDINAVWNGYDAQYAALLTNKENGRLEGISLVFTLRDTESNIDTFIKELRSLLGDGSSSYRKTKTQEQWTFANIFCTLKIERAQGFVKASIRIMYSETAGMPYRAEYIDTTGLVYVWY